MAALLLITAWLVSDFPGGAGSSTLSAMGEVLTGVSITQWGAVGAFLGALTGKTAAGLLVTLGNALVSAAEWCLRRLPGSRR